MATEAATAWASQPGNGSRAACSVNMAFAHHYLPTVYLVVIPLGLVGNGLGLWQLCARPRRSAHSALSLLVGNLGLADLLYVSTLPFLVSYYLQGRVWLFGRVWCRLTRGLFHLNLYASIGFLTCISVHRYLGIVHPMKMRGRCQALTSSLWLSVMVWVWVIMQVAPDFAFSKMDYTGTRCHDTTEHKNLGIYLPYTAAITVTGFVIPFLIIIGCYGHVVVVLCRNDTVDPSLRRRSIRLVIVVTRGLASLNSALNPLLYLMTSEDCVSHVRALGQRASHSLRSLFRSEASHQTDEKKINILCEQQVSDKL
ncbi:P2Y purinoceptor 1-like isoform X2 [Rhea pennata]|uniref:P2Y purinoceptor 1-like isoform X2 n=1 Tax=Rhea pennata TaxID=8795 RepID=UPI002E25D293